MSCFCYFPCHLNKLTHCLSLCGCFYEYYKSFLWLFMFLKTCLENVIKSKIILSNVSLVTNYRSNFQRFLSPLWQGNSSSESSGPKNGSSQPSPQQQQQRNNSTATEATFDTRPYKLHKLEEGPSSTASCTRDEALIYYRQMQMIRRIESAAGNLYKEKVRFQTVIKCSSYCIYISLTYFILHVI